MRIPTALIVTGLLCLACDPASKVGTFTYKDEAPLVVVDPKGMKIPALKILDKSGELLPRPETLSFVVDPPGVARIQGERIVPIKKGETVLIAQFSGNKQGPTAALSIVSRPLDAIEVTCDATPCRVKPDETVQLKARPSSKGDEVDGVEVQWESANPDLLAIDAKTGAAKGLKPGRAVVRATAFGVIGTGEVQVKAPADLLEVFCPWPAFRVAGGTEKTDPKTLPSACEVREGAPVKLHVVVHAGGEVVDDRELRFTTAQRQLMTVVGGELAAKSTGTAVVEVGVEDISVTIPVEARKAGPPPTWRGRVCNSRQESEVSVGAYKFNCDNKKKATQCLEGASAFLSKERPELDRDFLAAVAAPCCCEYGD